MAKAYIRIWHQEEPDQIAKHLLIAGDLSGDCANCRQIGIDYKTAKECPNCHAVFKYIASRSPSVDGGLVHRIKQTRPDLIFIDFSDFKKATGKDNAREFFK
jgi:hypothetical protein